ncbi:single-stranded DNA-binding protein [Anaerococcus sp.]|uniref:single-stranded DNA-binding protein n=1 Tax=Anaerococcus sp. TaxID=1872515 RepID=UPI002A91944D|nr:single-stranded DNA-binding protein [Anaerococcus sp.]MDY6127748.1 single-stranded DNA-binding protein [Anaerococcus sp.]
MINNLTLVGRLLRDPELRYTKSSKACCSFVLAVDREMSKEKREEAKANNYPTADFPRVVVWNKMGEVCSKYLQKGSLVAIVGKIQTGSYKDKDGKMVYTTDVIADRVRFLDTKSGGDNKDKAYNNITNIDDYFDDDFVEIEDDNIPF